MNFYNPTFCESRNDQIAYITDENEKLMISTNKHFADKESTTAYCEVDNPDATNFSIIRVEKVFKKSLPDRGKSEKKCDFILDSEHFESLYFVEIKDSRHEQEYLDAIKQITNTFNRFKENHSDKIQKAELNAMIITSESKVKRVNPNLRGQLYQLFYDNGLNYVSGKQIRLESSSTSI